MIEDGFWSSELEIELKNIKRLKKKKIKDYFLHRHKINRSILFSAIIIRKMFDDEKDVELYFKKEHKDRMPALKLLKYKVKVVEYPVETDDPFIIDRFIPDNYNFEKQKVVEFGLNDVCNQIIHAYVWTVILDKNDDFYGIVLASDKVKEEKSYLIPYEEWIKALEYCINNNTLKQFKLKRR